MEADILLRAAQVSDGSGPVRVADVAVTADRIAAVGDDLPITACGEVVDASGLLLCPGFIDLHAHSALRPFSDPLLAPKVAQGFTTELIMPDGLGPAPVTSDGWEQRRRYLAALEGSGPDRWEWRTLADYLTALAATRPSTSLVASVAHSAVRDVVMGPTNRQPTQREVRAMRDEIAAGFEAGARVLSFGLIYAPGLYADTEELVALAKTAAEYHVPLMPHVRNESTGVLDAIGEFVTAAERSGAPLHVSHVKLVSCPQLLGELLSLLTKAAERVDLTFDQYPYGAGSTLLAALLPPYVLDGGPDAALSRLGDPGARLQILRDMERGITGWENLYGACGPDNIVITEAGQPRSDDVGKSLTDIATERQTDPAVAVLELLVETGLDVGMVDHYADEEIVRTIFAHPLALVGSDGIFNQHPHPRLYGTAARVLGRYALREKLISVEDAVARLTSRAADRLGLDDRGRIAPGLRADLVLIDPEKFVDTATYTDPCLSPPGVERVLIAGETVYHGGEHSGVRRGQVVQTARATTGTH